MKQKLLVLMAILMAAVSSAWAYVSGETTVTIDEIVFKLKTDGTAEVGDNKNSTVSAVVIPESVEYASETYRVTSISSAAFQYASAKTIKVGNNVTSIGSQAFKYCAQLELLTIGSSVTEIGNNVLDSDWNGNCSEKTIIALPSTAPTITGSSFAIAGGTPKIVSIKVPQGSLSSYKNARGWALYSSQMSEIDPTAVLEYKNFDATNHTAAVTFSVTANKDASLGSVDIPASIVKNGVTYNVTAVAEGGFTGCTGITAIKLPPTITAIGANAFSGCSTLTKIYLTSANAPSIGTDALATGVKIWATEAGYDNISAALGGNYTIEKLKEISYKTVSGQQLEVVTNYIGGISDSYNYYSGGQGAIVYEGDITELGYSAFKDKTDLQEIEFKAGATSMQNGCFSGCTALTSAVLPEGITELPQNTFKGCTSLTSVKLPESLTKIKSGAFENCSSLKTLIVPEKVTSITYDAFSGCPSDGFNLIMLPSSAPGIDYGGQYNPSYKFKDFTPYKVTVHNNAYYSYDNDAFWSQYSRHKLPCLKYKTLNNALGTLDKDADFGTPVLAHYYNSSDHYCYLEFAEKPKIGANAFKGFDQMEYLVDDIENLTSIGASAFEGCTNMSFFQVPTDVITIGADAFKGCTGLNNLTYKGGLDDWCKIDFANAAANPMNGMAAGTGTINNGSPIFDAALTIPSGIETLKAYTFVNSYITSLNLGEVTAIGNGSFKDCSALATITVSTDEPATLGENAFEGINKNHVVKVPLNSYLTYKGTDGWKTLKLTPQSGTIALTDAEGYKIDQDVDGCEITYTRTVSTDNWMGVCLPFDLVYSDWSEQGEAAILTAAEGETLDWTILETGAEIKAGTPFIFKPSEAGTVKFEKTSATLYSKDVCGQKAVGGYTLYGNFETVSTMYSDGLYALSGNAFRQANNDGQTLKPYRVYIKANTTVQNAPAQIRCRINGVDATAIEGVEYAPVSDGKARNLQGIEVGDGYKGIVIVNGKKVLRK